jgi:hypothetical protein
MFCDTTCAPQEGAVVTRGAQRAMKLATKPHCAKVQMHKCECCTNPCNLLLRFGHCVSEDITRIETTTNVPGFNAFSWAAAVAAAVLQIADGLLEKPLQQRRSPPKSLGCISTACREMSTWCQIGLCHRSEPSPSVFPSSCIHAPVNSLPLEAPATGLVHRVFILSSNVGHLPLNVNHRRAHGCAVPVACHACRVVE